ncbi:MAG: transposase [Proteobacteria bacterium]|nr:transposase [Pseudomonadota bacterium]
MTIPRSQKVDLNLTSYYHCMSRCVRRTYLCGVDRETGQDFTHRKGWLEGRILELSTIFAIKVCAYAVMSNHYHVVLYINASQAKAWETQEIIDRWKLLYPRDAEKVINKELSDKEINRKIQLWRDHLMDLSWYMKCLNEPIARFANNEDNCTGRFWEGRFKSQALLDEGALLSAMVYVDLNPIRANQAETPEGSAFTSIYERIKAVSKAINKKPNIDINKTKQPSKLLPFASVNNDDVNNGPAIDFKLSDYLELVDTTGRILRNDKRGAMAASLEPILKRISLSTHGWVNMVKGLEQGFFYAIGNKANLLAFSARYSNRGPKGLRIAKSAYLIAA